MGLEGGYSPGPQVKRSHNKQPIFFSCKMALNKYVKKIKFYYNFQQYTNKINLF
jgi:hypothetical protein